MRCPFLREAQVKTCVASRIRKLIVRLPEQREMERCSSPAYEQCPDADQYRLEVADRSHCPFLQESLVQYCSAAPVVKYIPYTDSRDCRCATERHCSCDLYRAMAGLPDAATGDGVPNTMHGPMHGRMPDTPPETPPETPEGLLYSENHMWLDLGAQRLCRIGVDSFMTGLLRSVDAVEFVTRRGRSAPEATIVSDGTRMTMRFPATLMITAVNAWLRTRPSRILDDPYGSGWLFEGLDPGDRGGGAAPDILIPGASARGWMLAETARMNDFIHGLERTGDGYALMADGGEYQKRIFPHLDAAQRMNLIAAFFTVRAGRRAAV